MFSNKIWSTEDTKPQVRSNAGKQNVILTVAGQNRTVACITFAYDLPAVYLDLIIGKKGFVITARETRACTDVNRDNGQNVKSAAGAGPQPLHILSGSVRELCMRGASI